MRAGLRALQERDAAVDRWLREEVAPAYDATKADPARSLPATEVFAEGLPKDTGGIRPAIPPYSRRSERKNERWGS